MKNEYSPEDYAKMLRDSDKVEEYAIKLIDLNEEYGIKLSVRECYNSTYYLIMNIIGNDKNSAKVLELNQADLPVAIEDILEDE